MELLIILVGLLIISIATSKYFKYYLLINKVSLRPKIYVTLTTTPIRIHKIKEVIDCIFSQTIQPDNIILNLPKNFNRNTKLKFDTLPEYLLNDKRIIINFTDDLGPATKIIPTCKLNFINDNDIIFSIDDDIVYPQDYLEKFLFYYISFPDCCITGCSELLIQKNNKYNPLTECLTVNGYSGVLYLKKFLKDIELSNFDYYSVPLYYYLSDDLVISNYLKSKNIPIITHSSHESLKILHYGLEKDALHKGGDLNNIYSKDNETKYKKTAEYLKQNNKYYINSDFY